MNVRIRVYYAYKGDKENKHLRRRKTPYKLIRARNEEKAMEIFKMKHPDLIPRFPLK